MAKLIDNSFFVTCAGQIESANFGPVDGLYCRYSFCYGPDWTIAAGLDTGLSQTAMLSSSSVSSTFPSSSGGGTSCVWNFPVDISFQATNIYGWPRMALCVYGLDFLGRDVVRGYGSVLLPLSPGSHSEVVQMYTPLAVSTFNQWASWWTGTPPEFYDSKFTCQGDGRDVTRVQATGSVRCKFNITTKGMKELGYSE